MPHLEKKLDKIYTIQFTIIMLLIPGPILAQPIETTENKKIEIEDPTEIERNLGEASPQAFQSLVLKGDMVPKDITKEIEGPTEIEKERNLGKASPQAFQSLVLKGDMVPKDTTEEIGIGIERKDPLHTF